MEEDVNLNVRHTIFVQRNEPSPESQIMIWKIQNRLSVM